jgi:hypothetical protein
MRAAPDEVLLAVIQRHLDTLDDAVGGGVQGLRDVMATIPEREAIKAMERFKEILRKTREVDEAQQADTGDDDEAA